MNTIYASYDSPGRGNDVVEYRNVTLDDAFEIVLKSNPQNGYMWYYQDDEPEKVGLIKQTMQPLPRYSGTRQHFLFQPHARGETKLSFVYKRSWEKIPYATFGCMINIV